MRKKKLEQLKDSIKKDLIKEMKKEEEKKKKELEKKELQYVEPIVIEHTKDDLDSIRKSFLKITIFMTLILFLLAILLFINPFKKEKEKQNKVESKPTEETYDPLVATLDKLEEGIIPNSNIYIIDLFNSVVLSEEEKYIYDSTYLYSEPDFNVKNIDDSYLLFLNSKTKDFEKYFKTNKMLTKSEICSNIGNIKIPESTIFEMINNNFMKNEYSNTNFTYSYYLDGVFSTYVDFVYSDGYYVSFCNDITKNTYTSIAKPIIKSAEKIGENIVISAKVAFITEKFIYADYQLTKIINDKPTTDILNYISLASEYEYIFIKDNGDYKLDRITKVN